MTAAAPSAPGTPQLISQSSSKIAFYWTEPFDNGGASITEYEVTITRVSDSATTTVSVVNANTYTFTSGIVAGEAYEVTVKAKNSVSTQFALAGTSSPIATFYSSNAPETVTSLSSSALTKTGVTLTWSLHATAALQGYSTTAPVYVLWMDDCNGGAFETTLSSSTSATSHTLTGMTPGITCRFRMRVTNNVAQSAYSSILSVTFAETPGAPASPQYVSRSGGDSASGLSPYIQIQWSSPSDNGGSAILGYKVEA